ncbi:dimethylaniline monooxygenase (N-oxide-forming) [Lentinus tigrinus ALCF2SS1-7]|uniref:Dimethylaniline monooxygenase (N-oxide-forming) n=1 Tax=Lentinus tigrinus ALCF2SS1-6 TaxID=1328759 RepID=A0A5C2RU94_9APHY|nr:dimethylaniline monooxygenase (N-oxide-forming) [Lentinus tigrinus ALCF2SS1-6]RPD70178.1 dimethylaniline monooxygenase (N-oxide-forming) [Lentinus tigrinus ALCF2SS1-7]
MALDPHHIASVWLTAFGAALHDTDVPAVTQLFVPNGWLRDLLALTWDLRTLEGQDKVSTYLSQSLRKGQITAVRLDHAPALAPRSFTVPGTRDVTGVEFGFTFDLPHGRGRGHTRLVPDTDGAYRAFTVLLMLYDLRGHEELGTLPLRDDVTGLSGRDVDREYAEWVRDVEADPYVLIVGAGQSGLQIAARFKQMNIPALVIDRNARLGDNWRLRYPTLTLHSIRRQHTLLYQPYPSTWPELTPRDKIASWLEQYPITQDLVVWMSTELKARPQYDTNSGRWDVTVVRNGTSIHLHPSHIVMATGQAGRPIVPSIDNVELFRGQVVHSSRFPGGAPFAGKRAVVVGAGNSAIDICQDLVLKGAESVTMIQRSSTCVVAREFVNEFQRKTWPEDEPLEISDFKFMTLPLALMKKLAIADQQAILDAHKEMHENLRKGGVNVTMGPEGEGAYLLYYEKGGGFWLDKGGAELIGNGSIKVKSGVSPARFTESGLVLTDGTDLAADLVVFATGYATIRESNADLFDENVLKRLGPVSGMDDEGEVNGSYRPCGHPGLWFATGDFLLSRFLSKSLAIQIKAIQIGLIQQV